MVAVGVGVVVAVGFGVAALGIVTPLSQTNFFPDLTQVNFLLPTICVALALGQEAPALALAAFACKAGFAHLYRAINVRTDTEIATFLMSRYWHYKGIWSR